VVRGLLLPQVRGLLLLHHLESRLKVVPAGPAPLQSAGAHGGKSGEQGGGDQGHGVADGGGGQDHNRFKREEVVINGWETEQV
jgi:hypothetical protein